MTEALELHERAAQNQDRFRDYNERVKALNEVTVWVDPPLPDWTCECAYESCTQPVQLTIAEYEAVRADPTRFLVSPSSEHVVPEVERVVARSDRFWVVEKVGPAGDLSEELETDSAD